jgi:hypothetical protein
MADKESGTEEWKSWKEGRPWTREVPDKPVCGTWGIYRGRG